MTIIKVTNKIGKGELALPSVKGNLKSGSVLSLDDASFQLADIQSAIKNGYLSVESGGKLKSESFNKTPVKNITKRPVSINGKTIMPGETLQMSEAEVSSKNFKEAKVSGLISEGKIPKSKTDKKPDKAINKPVEPQTKMQSWDLADQKSLTKKNSAKATNVLIAKNGKAKSKDKDTVMSVVNKRADESIFIDLEDKEPEQQSKKSRTSQKSKSLPKNAKGSRQKRSVSTKTSSTLKPVGNRRLPSDSDDFGLLPNEDSLVFVDRVNEVDRIRRHPVLGKKFAKNNTEID